MVYMPFTSGRSPGFSTDTWHINCLERAVFLELKHFLSLLRYHHMLIHTDNTFVVSYINQFRKVFCLNFKRQSTSTRKLYALKWQLFES